MLGLSSTPFGKATHLFVLRNRSYHALVGVVLRLILPWEYLDKSAHCVNVMDLNLLSLRKGRSATCKTTKVLLGRRCFKRFTTRNLNTPEINNG